MYSENDLRVAFWLGVNAGLLAFFMGIGLMSLIGLVFFSKRRK